MTEQELKKFCIQALEKVPVVKNRQERVKIATDFAERLFITNYFSKEIRTNFIKNELRFHFDLTDEEINKIIHKIDIKESQIKDKLQIVKFKRALDGIEIFDDDWFKDCNVLEVKKIINYIKANYKFSNQDIFKKFVKENLCKHFSLTEEEQKEVMKEV